MIQQIILSLFLTSPAAVMAEYEFPRAFVSHICGDAQCFHRRAPAACTFLWAALVVE